MKWISTKESRVRQETRRISGEDLPVWKWIYNCEPLPTEVRQRERERGREVEREEGREREGCRGGRESGREGCRVRGREVER